MPLQEYRREMIYFESVSVPLFGEGTQKSFADSAVRILVITVFRGVSEHYLKVLAALEHEAKSGGTY
jgi:hypothetical protein